MSIVANLDINLRGNTEGIDRAAGKTLTTMDGLSKKVEAATTAIGGSFGALLGGPIGAVIGGMAGKAVGAITEVFSSTREKLSGIIVGAAGQAKEQIAGVSAQASGLAVSYASAWEQITSSASEAWERVSEAAQPVLSMIGDGIKAVAEQIVRLLKPVLNWLVSAFEGVAFTARAVFEVVVQAIKPAWDWLVKLVDQWVDLSAKWPEGGEIAIKALRGIAVAGAYVYDAIKSIGGVAEFAAGKVVEHLGPPVLSALSYLTEAIGSVYNAIYKLADAAKDTASRFVRSFGVPVLSTITDIATAINTAGLDAGNRFFRETSAKLDGLRAKAVALGLSLSKAGGDSLASFGSSAKRVGTFFDDVLEKFKLRDKLVKTPEDIGGSRRSGAVERGSMEAFKIIAEDKGDKMFSVANKQLQQLIELNKKLDRRGGKGPGVKKAKL